MKKAILVLIGVFLFQAIDVSALFIPSTENPLFKAIEKKETAEALDLIQKDPKLALKEIEHKITPLMAAAYRGNIRVAKALIHAGASPSAVDKGESNVLMYSVANKENYELVKLLISSTPDVNLSDTSRNTALMLAAENGFHRSVKLLIDAGAHLELDDYNSKSALALAVDKRQEKVIQLLVQEGANLETRDKWSMTPLMNAAFSNRGRLIILLLKLGADFHATTTQDITVSSRSSILEPPDPLEFVIRKGSTALDIATQMKHRCAQYYLESHLNRLKELR